MTGFLGKVLIVDLSNETINEEQLDTTIAKAFIGGSGLSAYYYYKQIQSMEHPPAPLSEENHLYILTGPLTGLPGYCTARSSVCARSPLTGFWGESNVGGHLGPELKLAGYDGIIIKGKANRPLNLLVTDSKVSLHDAKQHWGKGTYEVIETLPEEFSLKNPKILCIGPAGEQLVDYACIMTSGGRTAGRTGMGAVMGSKHLKSIIIHSSIRKRDYQLPEEFKTIAKGTLEVIQEDFIFGLFKDLGTAGYADVALEMYGDMPIKNWSKGSFSEEIKISGASMAETIANGAKACYRCPIGCGREIKIEDGPYAVGETDGPEFETLAAYGTNLLINDLEAVSYLNHVANDLGFDTISSGGAIGCLYDLIEKDAIPAEDLPEEHTYGFGNIEGTIDLLQRIVTKEGIGALLSKGSKKLADHYKRPDLAPQVAGLEASYHDPRAFSGMAIMYLTSPRGACHLSGDAYLTQQGQIFPEAGIDLPDDRFTNSGMAATMANLQSYRQLYNAMGVCQFYNPPAADMASLLGMAIGEELTPDDLITIGDRLFAIKRLINLKLGWTTSLQTLPDVMLQPLHEGATEGNVPDIQTQLKEWYEYRDYDFDTGVPSDRVLKKTQLDRFIH